MSSQPAMQLQSQTPSNGGRLVTADGRTLPLLGVALSADARGGIARVKLTQRFKNHFAEPLKVTYQVPLPADAAVSGFAFLIGETRVVGEVDARKRARQRFEEALLEGRTAALLDQERTALFTQEVGNIPPHTEVSTELELDQRLLWLPEGAWEFRFPTVVAPRYQGTEGRVRDAAKVAVDVADAPLSPRAQLAFSIRDAMEPLARPESPSHRIHAARGTQRYDVTFEGESGAALDRDVVVRWKAAAQSVGASLDTGRPRARAAAEAAYGLLTLVPPSPEANLKSVPRDVIVLLDTSGSMSGQPLDQARRIVGALVDTMGPKDKLEMIEFSNAPRRWRWRPAETTDKVKKEAQAWLAALRASGGTEMKDGILEALAPLRKGAQRQVVLVTDGLIGFEDEVLEEIRQRLPEGSRVHAVGVGSGVNRSLTRPAARVGRGVELVVGLDEDVERVAQRLCARTAAPFVTDVAVSGSAVEAVAPARIPDLFGGAPCLVSLKLRPQGGSIVVKGRTAYGPYEERLEVAPIEKGEGSAAVATLFAREQVEDLETSGAHRTETDPQVERLGIEFQISTRLTSWVAVTEKATVDPLAARRDQAVPHELPYGMSAEGLGLRPPMQHAVGGGAVTRAGTFGGFAPGAPPAARARLSGAPPPAKSELFRAEEPQALADDDLETERTLEEATGSFQAPKDFSRLDQGEEAPADEEAGAPPPAPAQAAPEPERAADKKAKGAMRPAPSGARGAPPQRQLRGRVLLQKDGRAFIEIKVQGGPLRWSPRQVRVTLEDGTTFVATLVPERTTLPTTAADGMALTLAIEVGTLTSPLYGLAVTMDGETVTVLL